MTQIDIIRATGYLLTDKSSERKKHPQNHHANVMQVMRVFQMSQKSIQNFAQDCVGLQQVSSSLQFRCVCVSLNWAKVEPLTDRCVKATGNQCLNLFVSTLATVRLGL